MPDPDHSADEERYIVVIDPSVLEVFPDGRRVNQALRALATVLREQHQTT